MKRKQWVRVVPFFLILLLAGFLTACGQKKTAVSDPNPEKGIYNIYYKNAEGTELIPSQMQAESSTDDQDALFEELMRALQSQKKDDPSVIPAVSSDLVLSDYDLKMSPFLTLDFTSSYSEQSSADEILCRAALVMTLTQIPDIHYLEILVDGQPYMDSTKKSVGKLSGDKFITDTNGNLFSRQKNTLLLYFASTDGKALVESERTVLNDSSMAMEKLVMKLLIEGPPDSSARAVLPDTVSILDISIRSGTCYVNFDSSFLTDTMDLKPEIIIYSIVNSLSELNEISQVQILVNGSSNVKFMDQISLEEPFTKNLNYLFEQK